MVQLLAHGFSFEFIPKNILSSVMHPLSATTKIIGFAISWIPEGMNLLILYFLIKLFRLYEKAEIFSLQCVRYLRNIGYALLIDELLLSPIYQALLSAALTWHNPPEHRIISISIDQTNVGVVLMAFMIILISWIMAEGCKLQEEQKYTV